mgnify:CR=1 FL=1
MKKFFIVFALLSVLTSSVSYFSTQLNAFEMIIEEEDAGGVKKGHWTRNCDCKWPGKACNRSTHK